jgi:hypothetical protein
MWWLSDIPPKFGMLLSRSWEAKLKGTLQMDMSYATIPVFGKQRRLYRETQLAYMVSSPDRPNNHPIYVVDTDIGASIFYNDLCFEEEDKNEPKILGRKVNSCRKNSVQIKKMMRMMGYGTWILMELSVKKELG